MQPTSANPFSLKTSKVSDEKGMELIPVDRVIRARSSSFQLQKKESRKSTEELTHSQGIDKVEKRRPSDETASPRVFIYLEVRTLPVELGNNALLLNQQEKFKDANIALRTWQQMIAERQTELFADLIKSVPQYRVNLNDFVGQPPLAFSENGYGLKVDPGTDISVTEEHIEFTLGGNKKRIPSAETYIDKDRLYAAKKSSLNADAYKIAELKDRGCKIFAIADGSNWGEEPKAAAEKAVEVCVNILLHRLAGQNKISTRDIAQMEIEALQFAQEEVAKLGEGALATVAVYVVASSILVASSVGDCGGYLLRQKKSLKKDKLPVRKCFSIFEKSRSTSLDETDPGGRLGYTYIRKSETETRMEGDWRNLAVAVVKLQPTDILLVCSDGIYDDFNPHLTSSMRFADKERQRRLCRKLAQAAGNQKSTIQSKLTAYIYALTQASNLFLLENPGKKIPQDYDKYPGKLDHFTGIVFEHELQ